jgi:uncharacterized membrane protein YgcG
MPNSQQVISVTLSVVLVVSSMGLDGCKKKESTGQQASAGKQAQAPATTYAMPTADQLYQLVAPIALFPDNLIAIVLASSTFPDQITASWQWVQQNGGLQGAQLMQAVDQQPWDASVKGLTQFPDVLQQMATNLSWTSSLGDAYFNAPQNVMNAVQVMRQKAYQAGNLKSTPQQQVQVENQPAGTEPVAASSGEQQQVTVVQSPPQTIVIEPSQPDVVYVPSYNPTTVYGAPVPAYPGYSTGAMVTTGLVSFGVGMMVGAAINNNNCCGWGYNSWNTGWNNSSVNYNKNVYVSNSNTFANRANYNNANYNNVNRNNINANNVNRNNINANNLNRNDLNRGNTPQFDQRRNQTVGNRNQGIGDRNDLNRGNTPQFDQARNQGVGNRNQGVGDRNQGVANRNQGVANRNQGVGNRNQGVGDQRTAQRGYGNQPNRGASNNAMANYQQGGNARNDSARGRQSVNGGGNRGGGNTAQAQNRGGGGGGNRGGGGGARSGGGGARGGGRRPR